VLVLLQSAPNGAVLLLCLLAAVVLAPAVEEFLFRLLLQGWLERTEGAAHETGNPVAARFPLSLWLPAAIFASFHLRLEREPPAPETIVRFLIASAVARGALVVLGLAWLRWRPDQSATVGARPATWRDLGIVPQRFAADLRLGLAALAAVFVPVVGLQAALNAWLPARLEALGLPAFAPDPAPLFILALALGYLYRQTHRIVPSIVLHAGLNATMVLAAWLGA
jgi:membrane protease YdiL (CAAX protease family)